MVVLGGGAQFLTGSLSQPAAHPLRLLLARRARKDALKGSNAFLADENYYTQDACAVNYINGHIFQKYSLKLECAGSRRRTLCGSSWRGARARTARKGSNAFLAGENYYT